MKNVLTLIICLLLPVGIQAQMGKFFNTDRQLSSSYVTQVYIDRDGYLWATTRDGINRYDGYQFRVFKRENEQDNTLASNYVNTIMQDRRGLFYFGMYGALQTWDGKVFRNVEMRDLNGQQGQCYANCFLERKNGDVLAGTSGLGVMKFTSERSAEQLGGELADIHTVNFMLEDRQQRLWITTDGQGFVCYDGKRLHRYLADHPGLGIIALCEDSNGIIYVGTTTGGVYRLRGETFVHIESTGTNAVSSLYCDNRGLIIIGYDGMGIGVYDPRTGSLTDNPFFSREVDLAKSKVYSIIGDNYGNLWFGLLQKGIYKQPINFKGFHYMGRDLGSRNVIGDACVVCTLIDSQNRKWVGTDKDGAYCLSASGQVVTHLKQNFPSTVMSMAEDRQGRIWIGSYMEGYGWIDPITLQYHPCIYEEDSQLMVMSMVIDREGNPWLGTLKHGLLRANSSGHVTAKFVSAKGAETNRHVNSIVNNYLSQISLSPDGKRLYVATSVGICCLDIASGSWLKTFGKNCLNYGMPVRIAKEIGGHLWVGTREGLYCYDLKGNELKHYTREDGLPDNGVTSIEQALDGKMWMGTNHGLSCFNPKTNLFQNYFAGDGLQSNEFGDNASFLSSDGMLLFAGTGGINWFYPKDIAHTPWNANVQLTGFAMGGVPISRNAHSDSYLVTDTTVIASDHFQLSYQDNSFTIQFSTLTYENPEHITYAYSINKEPYIRLQPGANEVTFSHMQPGTYHFRIIAESNNQTTPEREFTVVVHAPWYKTIWAYLFYLALLIAAIWSYLAYRRRKEQDHLRLQEHIHAEELADAKLRFFMNISHEIRTPMTLIVTPLRSLIKNEQDTQRRSIYQTINRNAERILSLINQMMDLRKIDKGQMQMHMTKTDLVGFVKDVHTLFEHQATAKRITLSMEHDTDSLPVWIDRKNFDKVIVNILSNAFKFTPNGGDISIKITHDEHQARISISDNGEQIPEDKLDKIFERFYQTHSTVNNLNTGTGIGLDLTRALVELHHGHIEARNLAKGCEFIVTIPLGNSHLKPEEMEIEAEEENASAAEEVLEEPAEMPEITEEQETVVSKSGERMTIVVAEDDDEIREYLTTELSQDYDVHATANGRDALAEVYRIKPDIVLSDVMMPEMDGHTLCSHLKGNPSTNHIPVVLLTAKSSDEDRLEGLDTGADAYLVKPFNMDILRRTIINLINSHRLLQMKYGRTDKLEEKVDTITIKSPDQKLLDRVMTTINARLNDSDLSVDMIAEEVGISRVHLHRKMKELTGQTPHDFIRNIRLKRAATLLASQGMNVTEVMYACGFSSSASFSTLFKKFYGMSPRDYMREHDKQ